MIASMARKKLTSEAESKAKKPRGPVLFIQLTAEEEAALSAFIAAQTVEPDRSAVGRKSLIRFLESQGFWPPPKS